MVSGDDRRSPHVSSLKLSSGESVVRLGRYEATYGLTAETPVQEWEGYEPHTLTSAEFDDT
ncbi:hypothetical protein [Microbispora rosea]|uniref:hypothetical protein n=1 Tax=Microbispora rosea TaxID=58117 RepID=UPI003D923C12